MEQGWVSITPLRLDLTDETDLKEALANHPLNEETALAVSPARSSPEAAASVASNSTRNGTSRGT